MRPLEWMRAVRDSEMPCTVKLTAWAIGLRADLQGVARLKYETVADDTGLGRSTVGRDIQRLAEGGWLDVQNRRNGIGKLANSYLLTAPRAPVDNSGVSPGGGRTLVQEVDGVSPGGGRAVSPPRGRLLSEGLIEVSGTDPTAPVDNPHLAALLANMSRDHGVPS